MRTGSGYIPVDSDTPFQGLFTSVPSNKIPATHSPRLLNCVVRDGTVKRRAGGFQLGQQLVGSILALTEMGPVGNDPFFLALTTKRQYVLDPDEDKFIDITKGLVEYPIIAYGDNYFWIAGDHAIEFTVGREIPILDADVNTSIYTILSSSFFGGITQVNLNETLPDNIRTPSTDTTTIADDLNTEDTDFIDYAVLTDLNGRRFVMTNGRDVPRMWTGDVADKFVDWTPNYPNFVTCTTLCVFNEHLFLGGITTTTELNPQVISWSNAGDFDEFVIGDSADQLLYQLTDGIIHMRVLGDRLVVYSFDINMTGVFIGGTAVFQFEIVIPEGLRVAGPKSFCSINFAHIFIAEENFYLFDGSKGLRILGNEIYDDYKITRDQSRLHVSAVIYDFTKKTIYFSVKDIEDTVTTYTMYFDIYDLQTRNWSKEKYADNVTAWGFYTNRGDLPTWEDTNSEPVNNPWGNEIGGWAEEAEQLEFPIRCYGTDDGRVVLVNESAANDRDTEVLQSYETKDFEVPKEVESSLGRWGEVEFEAAGSDVVVEYSVDRGRTFAAVGTQDLDSVITSYRFPIDVISRTIRFRFTTTGQYQLTWIRTWVAEGGPQ